MSKRKTVDNGWVRGWVFEDGKRFRCHRYYVDGKCVGNISYIGKSILRVELESGFTLITTKHHFDEVVDLVLAWNTYFNFN